ncbi:MAG: peptidylprolyl isomerase [Acidobacteria bacterium]|nr:peptidylprolyl isomerase [Acidobacteriota bacterium]
MTRHAVRVAPALAAWLLLAACGQGAPGAGAVAPAPADSNAAAAAPAPAVPPGTKPATTGKSVPAAEDPAEHLTPPIATVNGETIYRSTYDQILTALRDQVRDGDPESVEKYVGARQIALDKAIDEELLYQEAVRTGYEPKGAEIDAIYAQKCDATGSESKYLATQRSRGLSKAEVRHAYAKTLALERYVKAEIEAKFTVSDDETRAFYDHHPELFTPDRWLRIGQIFVNAPLGKPQKERLAAQVKLTQGYDRIREGRSFESVARDISEDRTGPGGGMVGWVRRGGLPEALDRAVFALKPGEMTGIVESESGYHVVKVYEERGGRLETYDKVRDAAREKLRLKRRGDAIASVLSRLRTTAKIEGLQIPAEADEPR